MPQEYTYGDQPEVNAGPVLPAKDLAEIRCGKCGVPITDDTHPHVCVSAGPDSTWGSGI